MPDVPAQDNSAASTGGTAPAPASVAAPEPVDLTQGFVNALSKAEGDNTASPVAAPIIDAGTGQPVVDPNAPEPADEPVVEEIGDELPEDDAGFEASGAIDPKSTRGQQLWAEHKMVSTLAKPIEEGGVGHVPTVEDIRTYWQSHQITNRIYGDLMEGNPEFLTGMAAPNPEGMAKILAELPNFLTVGMGASNNPGPDGRPLREVFEPVRTALVNNVVQGQVNMYLDAARSAGSAEEKAELFATAKSLSRNFLNKELTDNELSAPKVDPFEAERQRLQRERDENAKYRERAIQENFRQYEQAVMGETEKLLLSAAEQALGNFKTMPGFARASKELASAAIEAIDANPAATNELRILWRQVNNAMQRTDVDPRWLHAQQQKIAGTILKWARPQMTYKKDVVAKEFGMKVARPATKRPEPVKAPSGVSTSSPVVTAQPLERKPGEDSVSYLTRSISAKFVQ